MMNVISSGARAFTLLFLVSNFSYGQIKTVSGKQISFALMDDFLKTQMDSLGLPGLSIAVINNGKIVYHRGLGLANIDSQQKVDDQTIFEAASLSKPVFAYFVMKMVEKGILNLDKPLYQYLPNPDIDYDDRYKLITARMVLCHTSGFPNWRSENKGQELSLKFTPGTEHSYSGEGYEYLANVIAHLTNSNLKNMENIFHKEIAIPLHLDQACFTWNDYLDKHTAVGYYGKRKGRIWKPAVFRAASGLHTDALSYANFLIAVIKNKGLSQENINEMLKEQSTINSNLTDGLGFEREPTKYGIRYQHTGNNGNFQSGFMFFKEQENGFVVLVNCDNGLKLHEKLISLLTEGE